MTCRTHFALPGLYACNLDALPPEDARALVQRIAPRLSDAEAAQLASLCGGLPLALRVAASFLAERESYPAVTFFRRLSDTARLLSLTTVDAALRSSYDLLTPESRRAGGRWRCSSRRLM